MRIYESGGMINIDDNPSGRDGSFPKGELSIDLESNKIRIMLKGDEPITPYLLSSEIQQKNGTAYATEINATREALNAFFFLDSNGSGGNFLGSFPTSPSTGEAGDYYFNTTSNEYVSYNAAYDLWLGTEFVKNVYRQGNWGSGVAFRESFVTHDIDLADMRGIQIPSRCILTQIYAQKVNAAADVTIQYYNKNNWGGSLATPTFEFSIPSGQREVEYTLLPLLTDYSPIIFEKGDTTAFRGLRTSNTGSTSVFLVFNKLF